MGSLPVLKPREVEKRLRERGFELVRQRGSHRLYGHSDGRVTTVPFHAGRDITPSLLRTIAADIGLTAEELVDSNKPSGSNRN